MARESPTAKDFPVAKDIVLVAEDIPVVNDIIPIAKDTPIAVEPLLRSLCYDNVWHFRKSTLIVNHMAIHVAMDPLLW